jgi:hypothetical protein
MAKLIIKRSELAKYLRGRFTARMLADTAGITTAYAYALLDGTSSPSVKILDVLGIEILYDTTGATK